MIEPTTLTFLFPISTMYYKLCYRTFLLFSSSFYSFCFYSSILLFCFDSESNLKSQNHYTFFITNSCLISQSYYLIMISICWDNNYSKLIGYHYYSLWYKTSYLLWWYYLFINIDVYLLMTVLWIYWVLSRKKFLMWLSICNEIKDNHIVNDIFNIK